MQVILLEKVGKLGSIGDSVKVKNGYARNYLLPQHKALRSTKANIEYFKAKKDEIEAKNLKLKQEAEKVASTMQDVSVTVVRQASDSGFLFGSVRPADIVAELEKQNIKVLKGQLKINSPLKTVGTYRIGVQLHPEVLVDIILNVESFHQQDNIAEEIPQEEVDANKVDSNKDQNTEKQK
ncbi:MAG: 50S ribosomal protein L9 [Alphaproteobacteria bacterium]|nr:50S ribosomal protein L9 [Alphaproteobacteria bacterium]